MSSFLESCFQEHYPFYSKLTADEQQTLVLSSVLTTYQRGDFLFRLPQQRVGFLNETVEIALVGADALCLHCPDGGTLVLGRNLIYALTGTAAMVDAAV